MLKLRYELFFEIPELEKIIRLPIYDPLEEAMSILGEIMIYLSGIMAATKIESRQNAIGIYDTFYDKNGIKSGKVLWYEDPVASPVTVRAKYYDMVEHREYNFRVSEVYPPREIEV